MHQNAAIGTRAVDDRPGRGAPPEAAAFHANLAEVTASWGARTGDRLLPHRTGFQPDYPEAANNLGLALHALGARGSRRAVPRRPADAARFRPGPEQPGHHAPRTGPEEEARGGLPGGRGLDPGPGPARQPGPGPRRNRPGRRGPAALQEAVRCSPTWRLLTTTWATPTRPGRRGRGLGRLCRGPRLSPELGGARIHANLGLALQRDGKGARASCLRRAVELAPDDAEIWRSWPMPTTPTKTAPGHPLLRTHRRPEAGRAAGAHRPGLGVGRRAAR